MQLLGDVFWLRDSNDCKLSKESQSTLERITIIPYGVNHLN